MNTYIIIAMDDNGIAYETDATCTTWENACILQEKLEETCDAFSFLIYTLDQWLYELENGVY